MSKKHKDNLHNTLRAIENPEIVATSPEEEAEWEEVKPVDKPKAKTFNALSLVRNESGHWAVATLGITGQKVETLDVSSFDLLHMTLARANQILQQQVIDLRKMKI